MVLALNVLTAADDLAQAIASPPTGRPFQDAIGAAGRRACDSLGNAPPWALNLASNIPGLGALGVFPLVCQPYYAANGYDGPTLEPPFTGGQCAVDYRWEFELRRFDSGSQQYVWEPRSPGVVRRGPLSIRNDTPPGATCTVQGDSRQDWTIVPSQGTAVQLRAGCVDIAPGFRNLVFIRIDGQPDTCGDPPGELKPGNNPPPDPGPYNPGEEPYLGPDGEPVLPIPPVQPPGGFPPVDVPPDAIGPGEPGGSDPVNPENGPGDPTAAADPIGGGAGQGGEGEDVDFGDPPEGRAWVGCYVQLDVPEDYGDIPGSRPGNAVFPRIVGNVSLIHGAQRSQAVQLRSEWTDIFRASPAQVVDGARLNVLPSISYLVYPVSVPLCPESTCPPPGGEEPPVT